MRYNPILLYNSLHVTRVACSIDEFMSRMRKTLSMVRCHQVQPHDIDFLRRTTYTCWQPSRKCSWNAGQWQTRLSVCHWTAPTAVSINVTLIPKNADYDAGICQGLSPETAWSIYPGALKQPCTFLFVEKRLRHVVASLLQLSEAAVCIQWAPLWQQYWQETDQLV